MAYDRIIAVKESVVYAISEFRRKITGLSHQVFLHCFKGKGKLSVEPVFFRFVHGDIIKVSVTADMIPMNMRGDCCDGQIRQFIDSFTDIRDTQPGVNQ